MHCAGLLGEGVRGGGPSVRMVRTCPAATERRIGQLSTLMLWFWPDESRLWWCKIKKVGLYLLFFFFLLNWGCHLCCDGRGLPAGAPSFHWLVSLVCLRKGCEHIHRQARRMWGYLQQGLGYNTNNTSEGFEIVWRRGHISDCDPNVIPGLSRHHLTPDYLIRCSWSAPEEDK